MGDPRRSKHETETTPEGEGDGGGIAELIKRLAYLSAGTVFLTQDAAAKAVKELKLPREAVTAILAQIDRNKDELIGALTGVVRDFLGGIDLIRLLRRTLDGMHVRVSAEFSFRYDEVEAHPESSGKERRRRRG